MVYLEVLKIALTIFHCDVINGVAATRVTKMVLVTVSSTPGYFTYSNNS